VGPGPASRLVPTVLKQARRDFLNWATVKDAWSMLKI